MGGQRHFGRGGERSPDGKFRFDAAWWASRGVFYDCGPGAELGSRARALRASSAGYSSHHHQAEGLSESCTNRGKVMVQGHLMWPRFVALSPIPGLEEGPEVGFEAS